MSPNLKKSLAVSEVVIFTILPTITMFLYAILQNNNKLSNCIISECYKNGEFFLYSIALLSSAYTTIKVYTKQNASFIIILLIILSICYTIIAKEDSKRPINMTWLAILSLVSFIIGIIITWRTMGLKETQAPEPQGENDNSIDNINKGLQG